MFVLVGFAFVAGVVTILSPCILPILPIILWGGASGGKRKPLGVMLGFVASFTFFTLFLTNLVRATGISADTVRLLSVVIVFSFGVSLVLPKFQALVEKLLARMSSKIPTRGVREGFGGGLLMGLSVGIVWTPCVGPIMASVISVALTGAVDSGAVLITLAYAMGTAIPMFGVMLGGEGLLNKVPWLMVNTNKIQRSFGMVMILTAVMLYFGWERKIQEYALEAFPGYADSLTRLEDNQKVREVLDELEERPKRDDEGKVSKRKKTKAPRIIPGGEWFNVDEKTAALLEQGFEGRVTLVDFWTYTCINCIRTIPYLKKWHEKYADEGLVIVGVHAPEFEFEKSTDNVREAIADFELEYAVVQDNNFDTWRAFSNRYWPAKYLVDSEGYIRASYFGEGHYDEVEEWIQTLLTEAGIEVDEVIDNPTYTIATRTPELYLGYLREKGLNESQSYVASNEAVYEYPEEVGENMYALWGSWKIEAEYAETNGGALKLVFEASEVNLVLAADAAIEVEVRVDGEVVEGEEAGADVERGRVVVDEERLYRLVKLIEPGKHVLELVFEGEVQAFAITFG